MCGAIRPTKPTVPEIATPAPTASATCATSRRFSFSTSTPTWPASRSPSASASSRCAAGSRVGMAMARISSAGRIAVQVTRAEAAHGPEDQGAKLLLVGDEHQHADAGRGQRVDGDAGQQEGADEGDAFARRQPIDDDRCRKPAQEGGDRQQPRPEVGRHDVHHPLAQHDHRHRGQGRTARHAEQAGIGQGISEQALHGGATGGQRGAHAEGRDHARRTDGVEHRGRGVVDRFGRQADGRQQVGEPDRERRRRTGRRRCWRRRRARTAGGGV